jgi:hypothetical protein
VRRAAHGPAAKAESLPASKSRIRCFTAADWAGLWEKARFVLDRVCSEGAACASSFERRWRRFDSGRADGTISVIEAALLCAADAFALRLISQSRPTIEIMSNAGFLQTN